MRKITLRFLLVLLALVMTVPVTRAELRWHWEGDFSEVEQHRLKIWIIRTVTVIEELVDSYPFDLHIHFRRLSGQSEPVPWANTRRGRLQGITFYVDPDYTLQSYLEDWTASHELSHLLLPYIGKRHSWFAEGFASYMQYQVMQQMGVLRQDQVTALYLSRITAAQAAYNQPFVTFDKASVKLLKQKQYSTFYWGGAVYFLRVDQRLREQDSSLIEVVGRYLECCRRAFSDVRELVQQLDELTDGDIFQKELREIKTRKGFPPFADLFPRPG